MKRIGMTCRVLALACGLAGPACATDDLDPDVAATTVASPDDVAAGAAPAVQRRVHVRVAHQSLDSYARVATEVVHARIDRWQPVRRAGAMPGRRYTATVIETAKGDLAAGDAVSFEVAGDGAEVVVVGAPRFAAGDEAVLFLWHAPGDPVTGLLGLDRGVYRVSLDDAGRRQVDGLHVTAGALPDLLGQVRAVVEAEGRTP